MTKFQILFVFFCFALITLNAQSTPEAFLGRLPAIPNNVCTVDTSVIERFNNQIDKVRQEITEETDRLNSENQDDIKKAGIAQSGLSENDIDKLENGNVSGEQATKIMNKSISDKYDLSVEELTKVAAMSEEEQQQWALRYANQQTLNAKQDTKAASKKEAANKNLYELAKEQESISQRIGALGTKEQNLLINIMEQDTAETRELNKKIPPLMKQICSGICSSAEIARSKAAEKQIYSLKLNYCEKMSRLQLNYISQCLADAKALLRDYRRLEEIQEKISALQCGAPLDLNGNYCFGAVDRYAQALSTAYKYWVGKMK